MSSAVIITGDKELVNFINDISIKGNAITRDTIRIKAIDTERDYKKNLRDKGNYDEGNLESSIFHQFKDSGKTAEVGSNSIISKFIEFGTRPHKIRIKNKKVLSDGIDIFGTEVNHPGYRGNPALGRSYYKNIGVAGRKLIIALRKGYDKIR